MLSSWKQHNIPSSGENLWFLTGPCRMNVVIQEKLSWKEGWRTGRNASRGAERESSQWGLMTRRTWKNKLNGKGGDGFKNRAMRWVRRWWANKEKAEEWNGKNRRQKKRSE